VIEGRAGRFAGYLSRFQKVLRGNGKPQFAHVRSSHD